jgi:phenylpropionate dioxygenase-like ring-hydroxylating dioxygenase large terminal subunit
MTESELWPALRHYWLAVALSSDVSEKPKAVRLLDERLVLVRLSGQPVCFRDLCIHRGTPLSLGWVEGDRLICAYHGWNYNCEGLCVRIPALAAGRPIPDKARVPAYRCAERYGLIWVCLENPRASIPECPEFDDPGYHHYLVGPFTWKCGAARSIENFVDQAHFPWVHEGILGDRRNPEVIPVDVQRTTEELRYRFKDRPNPMHPLPHTRVYRIFRPFTIHQRKERSGGEAEVSFFTVSPHSAAESTNYLYVFRNFQLTDTDESTRYELDVKIMLQDQVILENQRPEELPLDLSAELHIKGQDAVAVEYRCMMAELGVK